MLDSTKSKTDLTWANVNHALRLPLTTRLSVLCQESLPPAAQRRDLFTLKPDRCM